MRTLEKLEHLGATVSIRHNADVLAKLAENDAQALRDLKSISLLLKSLTDEAKTRALTSQFTKGQE